MQRKAEPYKIKMVESIRQIPKEARIKALEKAGYNPFSLRAEDVYIDLLTDSGTGAMSDSQWSAMMLGDESYAGSKSFYKLEQTVKDITGYKFVIPTHQGRGAEQILFSNIIKNKGDIVISNMHFDTTKAHVEIAGGRAINCIDERAFNTETSYDFKGNFDLEKLEELLKDGKSKKVSSIVMTVTCNSSGGQPVSMENMKTVSEIAKKYQIPLIIDGARYAENAYFIKQREKGYEDKSIREIAREMFDLADAMAMSSKKDGLVNMGGILTIKNDNELYQNCRSTCVPMEGFPSYGGLSGRDMEALSVGLHEALDFDYLESRIMQVQYLGEKLRAAGVPIQYPVGGHAVFVDCKKICPHIVYNEFPAQAVCNAVYIDSGVRAVEIGSFLLGRDPDTGQNLESPLELMRLTIPRRTYTYNHMDVIAESVIRVAENAKELRGLGFEYEPEILRHFTARLKQI